MPKIAIVLPAYRAEASLRRAVECVLRQTYADWRLIVVDDGSPVPQRECIADLADADPRIETLRLERNVGAAAARNAALDQVREEWVAFLDADDVWSPRKLEHQLQYIARHPEPVELCTTGYVYVRWRDGVRIHQSCRFPAEGTDYRRVVYGCDLSPGATLLARTELFERFGKFDEALKRFEDWDWLLRCLLGGVRIDVAPQAFATVNNYHWPSYADVASSVAQLRRRHLGPLLRRNPVAALRFLSSLQLERGVAAWREGRRGLALRCGLAALLIWPMRNRMFFLRVARALTNLWRPRAVKTSDPAPMMHVISGLGVGGAEATLVRLVGELESRGIEQHVVSLQAGGRHEQAMRAMIGERYRTLDLQGATGAPRAALRLARHIRRVRPRVIQTWMYHADLLATLALWVSGKRRSTSFYWGIRCSDMDLSKYGPALRGVIALCRMLSPVPDGILVNSHAGLLSHMREDFTNGQMMLVNNAVSPAMVERPPGTRARVRKELGIPPEAFVAGILARTDPMKGYDMFLEVARRLPEMTAVAVGAGTEELEDLPNLLRLGLRTDVPDLLAAFDVVVSCSRFGEGFSNSILEAMAAGRPVVATDVGDSARVVNGGGIVVQRDDAEAMVRGLRRLMRDPAEVAELGAVSRERVLRDFTVQAMADQFLSIYTGEAV